MSITKLREKRTRKQPALPKGKATVVPERVRTLTAEEIYQMTEPGNQKRNSEICRELVKMIRQREKAAQSWTPSTDLPPPGGFLLRLSEKVTKVTKDTNLLYVNLVSFYSFLYGLIPPSRRAISVNALHLLTIGNRNQSVKTSTSRKRLIVLPSRRGKSQWKTKYF